MKIQFSKQKKEGLKECFIAMQILRYENRRYFHSTVIHHLLYTVSKDYFCIGGRVTFQGVIRTCHLSGTINIANIIPEDKTWRLRAKRQELYVMVSRAICIMINRVTTRLEVSTKSKYLKLQLSVEALKVL